MSRPHSYNALYIYIYIYIYKLYICIIYIYIELWPLAVTNEIVTPATKVKHVSCMRLEAYKPVITGKGHD